MWEDGDLDLVVRRRWSCCGKTGLGFGQRTSSSWMFLLQVASWKCKSQVASGHRRLGCGVANKKSVLSLCSLPFVLNSYVSFKRVRYKTPSCPRSSLKKMQRLVVHKVLVNFVKVDHLSTIWGIECRDVIEYRHNKSSLPVVPLPCGG